MTTHSSTERRSYTIRVPTEQHGEVADWFEQYADPLTARLNRYLIASQGRVSFRSPDDDELAVSFRLAWESDNVEPPASVVPLPTFGGTKPRLTFYSRNDVAWLAVRSW